MLSLQHSKGTNTSNYKSVFKKIDFIFSLSVIRTKQALLILCRDNNNLTEEDKEERVNARVVSPQGAMFAQQTSR